MTPQQLVLLLTVQFQSMSGALWALVAAVELLVFVEALRLAHGLGGTLLALRAARIRRDTAASMAHEILVEAEPFIIDSAAAAATRALREGRAQVPRETL